MVSSPSSASAPGDFVFAIAKYASGDWQSAWQMTGNVIDIVASYTSIPVAPLAAEVDLGTSALFDYPFIWLSGHKPVRFTPQERRNVKQYVERGGFFVIDDHNHDIDGIFHKTAKAEVEQLFGPLKIIPKDHPLYHCFFEFEYGPPATQQEMNGWGDNLPHKDLYGIMNGTRIGLLYSNRDYTSEWTMAPNTRHHEAKADADNTRFFVNMVVYALTR